MTDQAQPLRDILAARKMQVVCAWCKRVESGNYWIAGLPLDHPVSHGMCPDCAKKFHDKLFEKS